MTVCYQYKLGVSLVWYIDVDSFILVSYDEYNYDYYTVFDQ